MIGDDGAELERERVERALELVGREQQRRGERRSVPFLHAPGAGAQVFGGQRLGNRQRVRQRALDMMSAAVGMVAGTRRRARAYAVRDERLQARAEDLAQVAFERAY